METTDPDIGPALRPTAAATEVKQAQCNPHRHLCTINLSPLTVLVWASMPIFFLLCHIRRPGQARKQVSTQQKATWRPVAQRD